LTKVTVILWNLVLKDLMLPECVPCQLTDDPVVLMQVVAIMGKDQIRCYTGLELLKEFLYFFSSIRKETFLKSLRNYSG
jgi:hypothetical protein